MEKMPYRQELDYTDVRFHRPIAKPAIANTVSTDWRESLPMLAGATVTLRELRPSDAPSLFALLTTEEVSRFISPPPSTVDGFEKFIAWTLRQRSVGSYACFAVTIDSTDTAIGIFQLRQLEPGFGTAEWGFAIGSAYWGSGVFQEGAELLVRFAFETVGVHRLEARAAVRNGRGNGALQEDRRRAGRAAPQVISQGRRVSRSGAVDHSPGGLESQHDLERQRRHDHSLRPDDTSVTEWQGRGGIGRRAGPALCLWGSKSHRDSETQSL